MPFTQALTFNIGFPFKISEISLLLLCSFYVFTGKKVRLPYTVIYYLGCIFFIVALSVVINYFWNYPYQLREYPTRFGYTGDSIMRLIYFVLAVLSFFISVDIFLTHKEKYIKIWLAGALVAALYGWYLALFSFLKLPVFLLPGMEHTPQTVNGIIRCGTFLEGNYMGLYLLISAGMSFYIGRYITGSFLLLTIFTTFSTLSIVCIPIFLGFYFSKSLFRRKNLVYFAALFIAFIVCVPFFIKTAFYKQYIHEKLFSDISNVNSNAAFSKADRLVTLKTAMSMGEDNFVWGVGLSNFSRHYDHFYRGEKLEPKLYDILLKKGSKVISNNIYAEVLSETGIICLVVFLAFLVQLFIYARPGMGKYTLFPTLLCMMLCFMAYPSFIMIYLWCFMALPVAHYIGQTGTENPSLLVYD